MMLFNTRSNYDIQLIEIYVYFLWKNLLRIGFFALWNQLRFKKRDVHVLVGCKSSR